MNKALETELTDLILEALTAAMSQAGQPWTGGISPETRLYGYGSDVDSMGLVVLLIELEERVSRRYGVSIGLTNEQVMSQQSPLRTVGSLVTYLGDRVADRLAT